MATAIEKRNEPEAAVYRQKLLADLPLGEQNLQMGGVRTTYLEGGEGTPLVLLHDPGESAVEKQG